jgi:hypothetical protein
MISFCFHWEINIKSLPSSIPGAQADQRQIPREMRLNRVTPLDPHRTCRVDLRGGLYSSHWLVSLFYCQFGPKKSLEKAKMANGKVESKKNKGKQKTNMV